MMTFYHHILKEIYEKKAIYVKTSWSPVEILLIWEAEKNESIIKQIPTFSHKAVGHE